MNTNPPAIITAETVINAPIEKVWEYWTNPQHIPHWNNTNHEWHTPVAENDLKIGGRLFLRMERKDGSAGFDHECIYDDVQHHKHICYTTSDKRKTHITFEETPDGVKLTEQFMPESATPIDMQHAFCQSILENFKAYAESKTN